VKGYYRLHIVGVVLLVIVVAMGILSGCARGGDGQQPVVPEKVLEFIIQFNGTIMDNFYYFVALDVDGDNGLDGPLPVAAGPRWQNGWGTGSLTHYVEYHQGRYALYKADLAANLPNPAAGITGTDGVPDSTDAGTSRLTVTQIDFGAVGVTGGGMITAADNTACQTAGEVSIETDAAGQTVAGSVVYTPAADGSRALTAAEQAEIDALNAGGVSLEADSLQTLGIALTLGAPLAGAQTLGIAQTVAHVQNAFTSASTGATVTTNATLNANSDTPSATPPIAGVAITCGDLELNGTAVIQLETSVTATLIGPPYEYQNPAGSGVLRFTIDVADLGANLNNISINIITTTELIFDPTITLPTENVYDGLGYLGNRYITMSLNEFRTIRNSDGLFEQEGVGDNTLVGPATQEEKNAVDIADWTITLRRLR
jgi:hypothetical protein